MLAKTLKRAGLGFVFGMILGGTIALICSLTESGEARLVSTEFVKICGSDGLAVVLNFLLSGIIGAVSFAGMGFYEIEKWSMLRSALTHFIIICIVYFPIAYILFWITTITEALIMAGIMALWYFIIWLIMYNIYKSQVKELNKIQEQKLKENEDDQSEDKSSEI